MYIHKENESPGIGALRILTYMDFVDSSKKVLGATKLGIHRMLTDSRDWSSFMVQDVFF